MSVRRCLHEDGWIGRESMMKCFDSLKNMKISHREMTLLITKWRTSDMSSKFCDSVFNSFLFIFSDRHFDDNSRSIISDDVASPSV